MAHQLALTRSSPGHLKGSDSSFNGFNRTHRNRAKCRKLRRRLPVSQISKATWFAGTSQPREPANSTRASSNIDKLPTELARWEPLILAKLRRELFGYNPNSRTRCPHPSLLQHIDLSALCLLHRHTTAMGLFYFLPNLDGNSGRASLIHLGLQLYLQLIRDCVAPTSSLHFWTPFLGRATLIHLSWQELASKHGSVFNKRPRTSEAWSLIPH